MLVQQQLVERKTAKLVHFGRYYELYELPYRDKGKGIKGIWEWNADRRFYEKKREIINLPLSIEWVKLLYLQIEC